MPRGYPEVYMCVGCMLVLLCVLVLIFMQNQRQAVIALVYRLQNLKVVADRVGKQVC